VTLTRIDERGGKNLPKKKEPGLRGRWGERERGKGEAGKVKKKKEKGGGGEKKKKKKKRGEDRLGGGEKREVSLTYVMSQRPKRRQHKGGREEGGREKKRKRMPKGKKNRTRRFRNDYSGRSQVRRGAVS